jgi:hypothetical protein
VGLPSVYGCRTMAAATVGVPGVLPTLPKSEYRLHGMSVQTSHVVINESLQATFLHNLNSQL